MVEATLGVPGRLLYVKRLGSGSSRREKETGLLPARRTVRIKDLAVSVGWITGICERGLQHFESMIGNSILYLISRKLARQASEWLPVDLEKRFVDVHGGRGSYFISQESLKVTRPRSELAKPCCLPRRLSTQLETSAAGAVGASKMPHAICC